jgi:two-component system sensor histidine kinase ChiS
MLWIVALLFWILASHLYSHSQKHISCFNHISIDDGLSQSSVYCILQDKKGFMWLGTQEGLNRYDGYKFKTYKQRPQDEATISNNYVWTIFEDNAGVFWIGTYFGLNCFNREPGIFECYLKDKTKPHSLSHNDFRAIYEDQFGILWIGTYGGGLNKLDRKSGKFSPYLHDEANPYSLWYCA